MAWRLVLVQGFKEACQKGLLAGHICSGLRFELTDGAHHVVDSSDLAFQLAGHDAVKEGAIIGIL